MHIVLVEDNTALRKGITYRLADDGHSVDALDRGDDAADFLRQESFDLVILDINLPGQTGLEVLAEMRSRNDPRPVILLTARSSTEDRVVGLDAGADDYLVKPFAMDELAARVRALARRKDVPPTRAIELGPLSLFIDPPRLIGSEGPLDVPRRELMLLLALAENPGITISKDQLLDRLYGTGSETDDKVIEVYVSRLRKRLAGYNIEIRVHRGLGYTLWMPPQ